MGADRFDLKRLQPEVFDEKVVADLVEFLKTLRKFYNNRRNKASDEKEMYLMAASDTEEKKADFINLRNTFENERIAYMLKNTSVERRVVQTRRRIDTKNLPHLCQEGVSKASFGLPCQFLLPGEVLFGCPNSH